MSEHNDPAAENSAIPDNGRRPAARRTRSRHAMLGAAALGMLALGAAGGAAAWAGTHGHAASFDASLVSTPIAQLSNASSIGITGQVAEIFGNKFVVTDGTARALVETGPAGEGSNLVTSAETVTVQGRFKDGFLHAAAIRHADQHVDDLNPPPPAHGPGHGPRSDARPDVD